MWVRHTHPFGMVNVTFHSSFSHVAQGSYMNVSMLRWLVFASQFTIQLNMPAQLIYM